MEPFYVFVIRNDVWIYILSALGLFWFINEFFRSQNLLRRAIFGLEKEKGRRLRSNAIGFIILFAAMSGVVYYVNSQVEPTLPPELFKPPTPTPNIFVTPLRSPTPLGTAAVIPPTSTPPLVPTITLAGQLAEPTAASSDQGQGGSDQEPAGTPTPVLPTVTPFVGCTLNFNISDPRDGAFVSGAIVFSGTADFEDFQSYRLEANGPETNGQWASLLGRSIDRPVVDGFLGNVNLSQWQSGPYLVRLVGTNTAGSDIGFCVIQITLDSR